MLQELTYERQRREAAEREMRNLLELAAMTSLEATVPKQ